MEANGLGEPVVGGESARASRAVAGDAQTAFDRSAFSRRLAEAISDRRRVLHGPITTVELFLTERCTLACDYCFVANKRPDRRMSWPIAKAAVDMLLDHARKAPEVAITFFGGEPLLEFDLMRRVATYTEEQACALGKRVDYACTTNGMLMREEVAQFGVEHGFNYLVSVDGLPIVHDRYRKTVSGQGSWQAAMDALRLLKRTQGWTGVRMTVNPDTVAYLSAGVRMLVDSGVNQFLIAPNLDRAWTRDAVCRWVDEAGDALSLLRQVRRRHHTVRVNDYDEFNGLDATPYAGAWGCDAGRSRVAVTCEGVLFPCSRFAASGAYRLGSVWSGLTDASARLAVTETYRRTPACQECPSGHLCLGGCPAVSYSQHGNLVAPHALDCAQSRLRWAYARSRATVPDASAE